jgi:predicted CXXCH cytochrome family protein
MSHYKGGLPLIIPVFIVFLLSTGTLFAAEELSDEAVACLGCHGQKGLAFTFDNGETLDAFIDTDKFKASQHRSLPCTACHTEFSLQDHPQRTFKSREQYAVKASAICRQCHVDDQLKKSPAHAALLSAEGRSPVCVSCHNPHAITPVTKGSKFVSENELCLRCHKHAIDIKLRNGEKVSLKVDTAAIERSVHGKLACFDCHFGFSSSHHPKRNFSSARDFSIAQAEACRRCHFDKYTKTLESIHYAILSQGNLKAPVCTDCHGSHSVVQARADKLKSSRRCGRCHEGIFATYTKSVHGSALIEEHNADVPICADCHTAHSILSAHSQDYRDRVPEICGKCHGDAELMKKYGLYPGVVTSYLQDFHGVTLKFYQRQKDEPQTAASRKAIATCVDCHGIHDITKTSGPDTNLVKARLMQRCQKCHAGATEAFPDAWLSHYKPSLQNAPLVFLINATYKVFIPFMLIGLILQILLHIWRYAVNR